MFDLGLILKTLREQHGYTQAEVAKKLNIAPGTVSRWETNDNTPSTERLIEIAILYNTPINHLIGRPMEDTLSINKLTPDQQHIIMAIVSDFTQKEINHLINLAGDSNLLSMLCWTNLKINGENI